MLICLPPLGWKVIHWVKVIIFVTNLAQGPLILLQKFFGRLPLAEKTIHVELWSGISEYESLDRPTVMSLRTLPLSRHMMCIPCSIISILALT